MMINKVTRSITLDKNVNHHLTIQNIKNISGLVNELLRSYLQINDNNHEDHKKIEEVKSLILEKKAELMDLEQAHAKILKKRKEEEEKLVKVEKDAERWTA